MAKLLTELEIRIVALKESHKDSNIDELLATLAGSELGCEKAEALTKLHEADIGELNAKLSEYESGKKRAPKFPTVKVGKLEYLVTRGVAIKDYTFTINEIAANELKVGEKKIADHLVSIKSGVLNPKN
ncbi:MAG: hypothetical protein ACI93L_003315 [Cyclobacteriaceae bacterium]|jgi:hypothetical protein